MSNYRNVFCVFILHFFNLFYTFYNFIILSNFLKKISNIFFWQTQSFLYNLLAFFLPKLLLQSHLFLMESVVQLVRMPDCDSGGRGFEPLQTPHFFERKSLNLAFVNYYFIKKFKIIIYKNWVLICILFFN